MIKLWPKFGNLNSSPSLGTSKINHAVLHLFGRWVVCSSRFVWLLVAQGWGFEFPSPHWIPQKSIMLDDFTWMNKASNEWKIERYIYVELAIPKTYTSCVCWWVFQVIWKCYGCFEKMASSQVSHVFKLIRLCFVIQVLEFSWLFFHCDCYNTLLWAEDTWHAHSNQLCVCWIVWVQVRFTASLFNPPLQISKSFTTFT